MTEESAGTVPSGPGQGQGPPLRYVVVYRQRHVPPEPSYGDLATGVAALDQAKRQHPQQADDIVLMAVAADTDTVGIDPRSGETPAPAPVELVIAELTAPETPDG